LRGPRHMVERLWWNRTYASSMVDRDALALRYI
jgi:hypothetical protein